MVSQDPRPTKHSLSQVSDRNTNNLFKFNDSNTRASFEMGAPFRKTELRSCKCLCILCYKENVNNYLTL